MADQKTPREIADDIMTYAWSTVTASADLMKVTVAFWDKMVVLNGGVLALSFTAATSFRGHTFGDGGIGYLLASWKLFIASICLAIFAQWFAMLSSSHLNNAVGTKIFEAKTKHLENVIATGVRHDVTVAPVDAEKVSKRAKLSERYHDRFRILGALCGIACQLTTLSGLIWLYKFAHINFTHFF